MYIYIYTPIYIYIISENICSMASSCILSNVVSVCMYIYVSHAMT